MVVIAQTMDGSILKVTMISRVRFGYMIMLESKLAPS